MIAILCGVLSTKSVVLAFRRAFVLHLQYNNDVVTTAPMMSITRGALPPGFAENVSSGAMGSAIR